MTKGSLLVGSVPVTYVTGIFLYPVPSTTAPETVNLLTVLLALPNKVIVPRVAVVVLSSKVSNQDDIVLPFTSVLSMYRLVTDPMVALLNLITPAPGSESVVVVLKLSLTAPLLPWNP